MLRKTLAGLTLVAAALIANPFNHADAAPGNGRGEARACVNTAKAARNQAQNKFRADVRAARELEPAQRQAAVLAAQNAFRAAAQKANQDFAACIGAIDSGA